MATTDSADGGVVVLLKIESEDLLSDYDRRRESCVDICRLKVYCLGEKNRQKVGRLRYL